MNSCRLKWSYQMYKELMDVTEYYIYNSSIFESVELSKEYCGLRSKRTQQIINVKSANMFVILGFQAIRLTN